MNPNPLIKADFPDPDVIRVDDTYYMVSTTMHFMPGCVILRSYNLTDWEILTHVYEALEETDKECLREGQCAYGQGMWAASLRYHQGIFYICFVANDTGKTYLYRSPEITGPWKKSEIEGFYHDSSLLFDDDGRIYLAYGNRQIYIIELNEDLTKPKTGGFHQMVVEDTEDVRLGYEGTHFYKIKGKYYLFFIHWGRADEARRTQACYVADRIEGPYRGGDVLDDDRGYHNQGVAQGGIVDTPEGDWYGILFQDSGAVGRIPVLVPVEWRGDFPVFGVEGRVPRDIACLDNRPGYSYEPVYGGDDFSYEPDAQGNIHLKPWWEWNHIPEPALWRISREKRALELTTGGLCNNVSQAVNTLTQRLMYPGSEVTVTVEGGRLKDGDIAGLCLLQGDYALAGLRREHGRYAAVLLARPGEKENAMAQPADETVGEELARVSLTGPEVTLRVRADFGEMRDMAQFFLQTEEGWRPLGDKIKLHFKLDHFCGCRAGLCCYATEEAGGTAAFTRFTHTIWQAGEGPETLADGT
ncbi:MAG: family 43 glycosylhydrolase [Lachnospiraceae bacterium]|nr:family 43 glycosylhydrolase [Lachnospiraceae bacterium]